MYGVRRSLNSFRFRWVELEIAVHLPRPTAQKRKIRTKDIEHRLQKLESSDAEPLKLLMGTYDQIYEMALGLPDEEANRATIACAVKWVLCSFRPLTSQELLEAVSIQEDGTLEDDLTEEDILEPCSNLFIKDGNGIIRLAHLSVRQYFKDRHPEQYDPGRQHHQATRSCLWTIRGFRKGERVLDNALNLGSPKAFGTGLWSFSSFITYSRQNWSAHYNASERDLLLLDTLASAKKSLNSPFQNW